MALMGLRPGEAVALDVADYHDGWLTVSKARKGDRLDSPIRSTKTGKVKRLPVPQVLQQRIAEHWNTKGVSGPSRSSPCPGAAVGSDLAAAGPGRASAAPGSRPASRSA